MRKIGITQRMVCVDGEMRDCLEHAYFRYFPKCGVLLVPVPNLIDDVGLFSEAFRLDGFILSGGGDVDPELYGQKRIQGKRYMPERDKLEKKILEVAIREDMPVLGICRGMQSMNVYFGGKLKEIKNHVGKIHEVKVDDEGKDERIKTNSFHNFGITDDGMGDGMHGFARCADGSIEGIRHTKYPIAGIMWHPERGNNSAEFDARLIGNFVLGRGLWE